MKTKIIAIFTLAILAFMVACTKDDSGELVLSNPMHKSGDNWNPPTVKIVVRNEVKIRC